jgi:DNA-binding MarR family transcriptional regulator
MRKPVDTVNHQEQRSGEGVLELVHTVMHQVRSLQSQALRGTPHDVTHMESKVLGFFARQPGATQSDLVQHSRRDKAQLARLIKGLRERGLLVAEADAADRRHQHLSLTSDGARVQRSLRACGRQLELQATDGLSAAERQQLQALLQRVKGNLDPRSEDDPQN